VKSLSWKVVMVVITKDMEINKKKLSLWEDKEAMDNNKKLL